MNMSTQSVSKTDSEILKTVQLVHGPPGFRVTLILVMSVRLFVCTGHSSLVFQRILIKLGYMVDMET